jgi:hypothetical protein
MNLELTFVDWFHNVRIVLNDAKNNMSWKKPLDPSLDDATEMAENVFMSHSDDSIVVQCILIAMEPDLQRRFGKWGPYETITEWKACGDLAYHCMV